MNRGSLLWLSLWGFLMVPGPEAAARDIHPPFGLSWGETAALVERRLGGVEARIVDRSEKNGVQVWTVTGLVQPGLYRSLFSFKEGRLVGVELQYRDDGWSREQFNGLLRRFRQRLDREFGPGALVTREQGRTSGVDQIFVAYIWRQDFASVQLVYFSAQKGMESHRILSVHYRERP